MNPQTDSPEFRMPAGGNVLCMALSGVEGPRVGCVETRHQVRAGGGRRGEHSMRTVVTPGGGK